MSRATTHHRHPSSPGGLLLLPGLAVVAVVGGCAADDARRQSVANSAATIYEAALAIEAGVPSAAPAAVIRANASAIAAAQGMPYPTTSPPAAGVP